ncbi:MAG: hypothetical protein JSV49_08235 [Thermoplasmata archaeon]|nr:MAG: hypothetical protein JSV49_08235 [Thermoplasmata archaeon]
MKDNKIAESELIETAEALEDEEKDATVKAVEVKNEGTGVAVNEKSDAAIESRDQEVPSKDMPESEVAAVNSNPSVKSEVKVSVKSKVTKRAVGTKPKKHVKKSRRKIKRTNK